VNVPARGLGDASVERVHAWAAERKLSLFDALRRAPEVETLPRGAAERMVGFADLVERYGRAFRQEPIHEVARKLVAEVDLYSHARSGVKSAEAAQRKVEADRQKAEAAAARRPLSRASRSEPPVLDRSPLPLGFLCPLSGPFKWGDGWGAGRGHKGVDLLAPRGTENVAVVPGTFETRFWGGGGLALFLYGDDGHTYVYMHMLRVVGEPRHVDAGEVIGLTGASGNASAYHTHFEFHPGGGEAVDPFPLLSSHCPPMPRDH
jgi:murein DD-endopeptidase MepM/ murein hydrolase activator NlpD